MLSRANSRKPCLLASEVKLGLWQQEPGFLLSVHDLRLTISLAHTSRPPSSAGLWLLGQARFLYQRMSSFLLSYSNTGGFPSTTLCVLSALCYHFICWSVPLAVQWAAQRQHWSTEAPSLAVFKALHLSAPSHCPWFLSGLCSQTRLPPVGFALG